MEQRLRSRGPAGLHGLGHPPHYLAHVLRTAPHRTRTMCAQRCRGPTHSPRPRPPAPSPAAPCRLPPKYRAHLHRLFVVHCDLPLWVALGAVAPACTEALWRKVRREAGGRAGGQEWGPRYQGAEWTGRGLLKDFTLRVQGLRCLEGVGGRDC